MQSLGNCEIKKGKKPKAYHFKNVKGIKKNVLYFSNICIKFYKKLYKELRISKKRIEKISIRFG